MPKRHRYRPSPAMAVAFVALLVSLGGTAVALSGRVSGDSIIKQGTLSGNRLRNHTLTRKQISLAKLGTVPSATNARNAISALNAANATSAGNALKLGGSPPSAYQGSLQWALFDADGTILAQSGGISLLGGFTLGSGAYVGFPVPLAAVFVTGAYTAADNAGRGTPYAQLCGGGTGLVTCNVGPNTTAEAFVRTTNANNTTGSPHPFMIIGIP